MKIRQKLQQAINKIKTQKIVACNKKLKLLIKTIECPDCDKKTYMAATKKIHAVLMERNSI